LLTKENDRKYDNNAAAVTCFRPRRGLHGSNHAWGVEAWSQ